MTKKEFTRILEEYDYSYTQIEELWRSRPNELDEDILRITAEDMAPIKDSLRIGYRVE